MLLYDALALICGVPVNCKGGVVLCARFVMVLAQVAVHELDYSKLLRHCLNFKAYKTPIVLHLAFTR